MTPKEALTIATTFWDLVSLSGRVVTAKATMPSRTIRPITVTITPARALYQGSWPGDGVAGVSSDTGATAVLVNSMAPCGGGRSSVGRLPRVGGYVSCERGEVVAAGLEVAVRVEARRRGGEQHHGAGRGDLACPGHGGGQVRH